MLGKAALEKFLTLDWDRCLDIGSGAGEQAELMRQAGREVTTIDVLPAADILGLYPGLGTAFSPRDAVWCCHVLEHQRNPGEFLDAIWEDLGAGSWLALTVPPAKSQIVPGHVTHWSAGLLLYNLVLAGFDCSKAMVKTEGYDISVIVQKYRGHTLAAVNMTLNELADFFPVTLTDRPEIGAFDGEIESLNWD